jgi:hypothetical protein
MSATDLCARIGQESQGLENAFLRDPVLRRRLLDAIIQLAYNLEGSRSIANMAAMIQPEIEATDYLLPDDDTIADTSDLGSPSSPANHEQMSSQHGGHGQLILRNVQPRLMVWEVDIRISGIKISSTWVVQFLGPT